MPRMMDELSSLASSLAPSGASGFDVVSLVPDSEPRELHSPEEGGVENVDLISGIDAPPPEAAFTVMLCFASPR